jgi:RNA polymerase sigma-70 factor (family 1)
MFQNKNKIQTMGEALTQQQLLAGLARGEEPAFRYMFNTYYQILVNFAYRYLNDLDESRNIVQDVFVMLYEKREEIKIHTSLKAHLFQSVRNRSLNFIKREKMQRNHHDRILRENDEHDISREDSVIHELEGRIAQVVNILPTQCQRIYLLSRQEGIPNADIAEQLSISKRTVETQISKALKKIREDLSKHGYLSLLLLWDLINVFI